MFTVGDGFDWFVGKSGRATVLISESIGADTAHYGQLHFQFSALDCLRTKKAT